MKTLVKMLMMATIVTMMAACNKEEDASAAMTTEEAAEIVATSVAEDTEGLTQQVEDAAGTTDEVLEAVDSGNASCGYTESTNFSRSNPAGTLVTYNYNFAYAYELTCSGVASLESMQLKFTQEGAFDAPRLNSDTNASGELSVVGLDKALSVYTINGSYDRIGSQSFNVRNKNTYSSQLSMEINELTVNKTDYHIEGGSATVYISGTSSTGASFTLSGEVVFLGDGQIEITINGEKYTADLQSGELES